VISSILILGLASAEDQADDVEVDANGYIMFCPCMGRFGNQADSYLGALAFAKALNRTLVLPPFVEYRPGQRKSIQVPFETYFQVAPIREYHRVITMEDFFKSEVLPTEVWPVHKRISFCYAQRQPSAHHTEDEKKGGGGICYAKSGNPFGPFWDNFAVDFVGSQTYGPKLHYDVHHSGVADQWKAEYRAAEWPVLAFTGAPASYPVQKENVELHKYLFKWNKAVEDKAKAFIKSQEPRGAFVALHLRNGVDWARACDIIPDSPMLFAAAQCVGYANEQGKATKAMCLPSTDEIVRQARRAIKAVKATWVFVASDSDHMTEELSKVLKVRVVTSPSSTNDPHFDLSVMGLSNHFVGNCISSFSAFVKRERDVRGFPSTFFAFPTNRRRDEL